MIIVKIASQSMKSHDLEVACWDTKNDLCQDSIEGSDAHIFMPNIISTYLVKDLRYHDSWKLWCNQTQHPLEAPP